MNIEKFKTLVKALADSGVSDPIKKAMASVDGTPITDADGNEIDVESIELTLAAGGADEEAPADEAGEASMDAAAVQRMVADQVAKTLETRGFKPPKLQDAESKGQALPKASRTYRVKNFTGGSNDRQFKAHGFGTFLQWLHLDKCSKQSSRGKWLVQNDIVSKASFEGANSSGGALVPEEFMADLIRLVEEYGVARANCQTVPMTREVMPWPRRTGGLTGYWMSEAKADSATAITKSDPTFANVNLVAKKLATLSLVSSELMEDSAIALGDFFALEIAQTFAEEEDDACFNGDGTSTYGGIVGVLTHAGTVGTGASTVEAASGNTAFSTLDMADFHNVTAQLPRYAQSGAKWYISQAGFASSMERLAHAQGGVTRMETEQGSQLAFLGYPVEITQKLNSTTAAQTSTKILAFGNLAQGVLFGDRKAAEIRTSEDRFFDTDQVAIRGIERLDIQCHDFDSTTVAGPMIVLGTPSS